MCEKTREGKEKKKKEAAFTGNPVRYQQMNTAFETRFSNSFSCVIKNKYRGEEERGGGRWAGGKKGRASVELTCLVHAQVKYPLLSANYQHICIFIISI